MARRRGTGAERTLDSGEATPRPAPSDLTDACCRLRDRLVSSFNARHQWTRDFLLSGSPPNCRNACRLLPRARRRPEDCPGGGRHTPTSSGLPKQWPFGPCHTSRDCARHFGLGPLIGLHNKTSRFGLAGRKARGRQPRQFVVFYFYIF